MSFKKCPRKSFIDPNRYWSLAFAVAALDMCRTELINGMDKLLQKLGNLSMNKPECMRPCSLMYKPVCISNGKYRALAANQCVMYALNCALGQQGKF